MIVHLNHNLKNISQNFLYNFRYKTLIINTLIEKKIAMAQEKLIINKIILSFLKKEILL
jgi:hypothetical protein